MNSENKFSTELLSDVDWEDGMCLAEEIISSVINSTKRGFICEKRSDFTIAFVIKMPLMVIKKLSASLEELNLSVDLPQSSDVLHRNVTKRKCATTGSFGSLTKLMKVDTGIGNIVSTASKRKINDSNKRNVKKSKI